jgi:hypothetical protein
MRVFNDFLNGYGNPHNQLFENIRARTFAHLEANERLKESLGTPDAVRKRGMEIRDAFLASIGGLPPRDTALNARVTGTLDRDAYRIEKIIFESLPQAYVTSNLYVPNGLTGPAPAVLYVSGHHLDAKHEPEYQRVCHDLAINGFVVFSIDPVGQGERVAHRDPDTREMPWQWGTTEHSQHGLQCILTGTSIARYFLHDMVRALDYMETRDEIDASRIGVTGNSGGGTQTSLLCMSGDARVKCAVPCTYITSREHYFMAGGAQDSEQIQYAMTANGINYDDFFLPIAPTPVLIGAVDSDFFPTEGTALTAERLKRRYAVFGSEDKVDHVFAPGKHMYCKELREAAVNWFTRHLHGREGAFLSKPDEELTLLPPEDLWCTPKGHVRTALPERKTPHHLNADLGVAPPEGRSLESLREAVIDALHLRGRIENPVQMFPRTQDTQVIDGTELQSIFFLSETEMFVSGGLLKKVGTEPSEAVIYLVPNGTRAIDEHLDGIQALLDDGKAVFVFDVRGSGAVESQDINSSRGDLWPGAYYNSDNWMSYLAYMIGDCLLGMRVFDVMRAGQYLRLAQGFERIGLYAEGFQPALWGYLAGALDPAIAETRVTGLIESFGAAVRAEYLNKQFMPAAMAHGVLNAFDLPQLRALYEGRELDVVPVEATEPGA